MTIAMKFLNWHGFSCRKKETVYVLINRQLRRPVCIQILNFPRLVVTLYYIYRLPLLCQCDIRERLWLQSVMVSAPASVPTPTCGSPSSPPPLPCLATSPLKSPPPLHIPHPILSFLGLHSITASFVFEFCLILLSIDKYFSLSN